MATFRSQDIVDIIKVANTVLKLRYFSQEQRPEHRIYPSVDVNNAKPASTLEDVKITKNENRFDINIYHRYDAGRMSVTEDLEDAEKKIIALLETAILDIDSATTSKIILETKEFARGDIKSNPNNVNGIQSVLTVAITETKATELGVSLGSLNTVSIGTIVDAQMYDKPLESETGTFESVHDTARVRKRVVPLEDLRSFFFSIGHTATRATELRTLKRNKAKIACTINRNGVPELLNGWIVDIGNGAVYEGVETLVVQFEPVQ